MSARGKARLSVPAASVALLLAGWLCLLATVHAGIESPAEGTPGTGGAPVMGWLSDSPAAPQPAALQARGLYSLPHHAGTDSSPVPVVSTTAVTWPARGRVGRIGPGGSPVRFQLHAAACGVDSAHATALPPPPTIGYVS